MSKKSIFTRISTVFLLVIGGISYLLADRYLIKHVEIAYVSDVAVSTSTVAFQPVSLTDGETAIATVVADDMKSPGQVMKRPDLCMGLLENGFSGFESTLKIHIHNLREKLDDDLNHPRYIETVFGIGYRDLHPIEGEFPAEAAVDILSGAKIIDEKAMLRTVGQGASFRQVEGVRLLTYKRAL